MSIFDVKIIKDYIRACNDGWEQGWHERNGGNLTYRLTNEEVAACRPYFNEPREWVKMGVEAQHLGGEYFLTTGSGKFFRNVVLDPTHSIGIVEINAEGNAWRIVAYDCFGRILRNRTGQSGGKLYQGSSKAGISFW